MDEGASAPWPVMEVAIEPRADADREKLVKALIEIAAQDASFLYSNDTDSGRFLLKGAGEGHLDSTVELLARGYRIDLHIGAPEVAYRETLTDSIDVDHTCNTVVGHVRQFARVSLHFEPLPWRSGFAFESRVGGAVPQEYVRAVENGVHSAMAAGILAGSPVIDVRASLLEGAFHKLHSSALAFELASRSAFRTALKKGGAALLEPIMKVEVVSPEHYVASVIADLKSRRGVVQEQVRSRPTVTINALVPLANMFGYANTLRFSSKGEAKHSIRYHRYDRAPLPSDDKPPPAAAMSIRD